MSGTTSGIALGYGRKSNVRRQRRDADAVSVEKQHTYVERVARDRRLELVWFEDAEGHRSGRSERARPGYRRLLTRLADDPAVRAVIVYELDRAGRSVILIDKIIKLCKEKGVSFVCIKEGIDTDRAGFGANEITRIQMLAVLAENEANRVSERMTDTATYYRDELHIQWGMWPFGYRRNGKGKRATFAPIDDHAPALMRLFVLYTNGGGYGDVAGQLNKLGYVHVGRYGQVKPFTRETVRTIIGNVLFYAGYLGVSQGHAKQATIRLEGEGTYLERYARAMKAVRSTAITPLIDEETASAVIERRAKNEWTGRKSASWTALLTPIAYWRGKKLRAQVMYTGNWYRCAGKGAAFNGDLIDAELIGRLRGLYFPAEVRADFAEAIAQRQSDTRREELAAEAREITGQMELLLDLLSAGKVQRETYDQRYIAAERRLASVRAEMNAPTDAEKLMEALHDLAAGIDLLTPAKRKTAVSHIFERVDIADDGTIEWLHWREWAKAAFRDLAQVLQTMPPVSTGHKVCKERADWFTRKAA